MSSNTLNEGMESHKTSIILYNCLAVIAFDFPIKAGFAGTIRSYEMLTQKLIAVEPLGAKEFYVLYLHFQSSRFCTLLGKNSHNNNSS